MNYKGELSSFQNSIVAIDFKTIFSKKPKMLEYITKDKFERTFNKEYKAFTYQLFHNMHFNVCIVSTEEDIKQYEDELWGKYLFFNQIKVYKDIKDLAFDCKFVYKYFICENGKGQFLDNSYTLKEFKELM